MGSGEQDHRIDMVSVHVSQNARGGLGQRVRGGLLVVSCLNPSHHAEAPNIVEVDGLEAEEAEVGEVDPVTAILVASKIGLSNGGYCSLWGQPGLAHQGPPGRSLSDP